MPALVVADGPSPWPFQIANAEVVDARTYLTKPEFSDRRGVKLFNLCRSYRYQSIGYYVSLLAEARGHKPIPSITAIQDLKTPAIIRNVSDDLEEQIEHSFKSIRSDKFELSIYFGRNMARRYDRLSMHLFNQFQAPLLRAFFAHSEENGWQLRRVAAISANDVPESHRPFVIKAATEHFEGKRGSIRRKAQTRFDLAILHNPADPEPPSNEKALRKFIKTAESLGLSAELITRDDYGQLAEFDALFIRETTSVNHHTYRFSRRADSEGLVVIDDPRSIVRCANKVYQAELLTRHKIPTPKTVVVHRDNAKTLGDELGFPFVLKKPDSAFSQGVIKVHSHEELLSRVDEFFEDSELLVAQQFLSSEFDWRIGLIDGQPLYAAKYYMARDHWQIIHRDGGGERDYGKSETLPVELAPHRAVRIALKAANLIGDGLYGIDIKQSEGNFYIIEINDNPNLDAGYEDAILKDELYRRIMQVFLRRIELKKAGVRP